jgi:hypothetical protein
VMVGAEAQRDEQLWQLAEELGLKHRGPVLA